MAAGGIERPMTPATATSVRAYGSASNRSRGRRRVRLEVVGERAREPEQEARRGRAEGPPAAEDQRRERDEPAPGGHVLVEGLDEAEREVRAAGAASAPERMTAP